MFITHRIILIKSTFPSVVIFFHGCVPGVIVLSYVVSFIYFPGKQGFVPFITALWWPQTIEYIMVR